MFCVKDVTSGARDICMPFLEQKLMAEHVCTTQVAEHELSDRVS